MKKLIIVNGTMGVGKSTTSKLLSKLLEKSVFLDGDWCWDLNPFVATKETKEMVIDNITYQLHNFLTCSECEYIIFNWTMDKESMYDSILNKLLDLNYQLIKINLICSEEALEERWHNDKVNDWRITEWLLVSKNLRSWFESLDTIKIDTSNISTEQAAERMRKLVINQPQHMN